MQGFLIFLQVVMLILIGVPIGMLIASDVDIDPHESNGWISQPIKYFLCGAFEGHHWEVRIDKETGKKHYYCKNCGKVRWEE